MWMKCWHAKRRPKRPRVFLDTADLNAEMDQPQRMPGPAFILLGFEVCRHW